MTGEIVAYDEDAHFETVVRHWVEIGWSDGEAKERERLQRSLRIGSSLVGLVDGDAEALGHWVPGNVVHLDRDLSM